MWCYISDQTSFLLGKKLISLIVFQPNKMKWSLIGRISFHLLAYKSFQRSLISFGNASNQTYWFPSLYSNQTKWNEVWLEKFHFICYKFQPNKMKGCWQKVVFGHLCPKLRLKTRKQGFHEKVGQIWWVLHLIGG